MLFASRDQSLQILPPVQTFGQLSPSLVATKFNLSVGVGVSPHGHAAASGDQRETSIAAGQLKADEDGPVDNGISEHPSNLAGLLGLVPRSGDGLHAGLAVLNLTPATGTNRLLGDLLAEQQARTRRDGLPGVAHLPNSSSIDSEHESARQLSDRRLMLQRALAEASPPIRPLPNDPRRRGGTPPPPPPPI